MVKSYMTCKEYFSRNFGKIWNYFYISLRNSEDISVNFHLHQSRFYMLSQLNHSFCTLIYLFIYYIIVHEVQNTHIQRKIRHTIRYLPIFKHINRDSDPLLMAAL